MIKILVIEDDSKEMEYCCAAIDSMNIDCTVFRAGDHDAATEIMDNEHIDIFFIDVRLPGASGFDIAERIRSVSSYRLTTIVFITGEKTNQLEVHRRYHHYEYIEKPYSFNRFRTLMEPVMDALAQKNAESDKHSRSEKLVLIPDEKNEFLIPFSDICFAESSGRKLILHPYSGTYENIPMKLTDFVGYVNSDSFLRCHRSYAVNADKISSLIQVSRRSWDIRFRDSSDLKCQLSLTYHDIIEAYLRKKTSTDEKE